MNRIKAIELIFTGGFGFLLVGCQNSSPISSPTTPSGALTSLLSRLRAMGYDAAGQAYGSAGGRRILISGDPNWVFRINETALGIGSVVDPPTLRVDEISVPIDAVISIARS